MWFWDIFAIATKRFKVPVAIDVEGEILKQKQEYMDSLKEIETTENNDENKETEDGEQK